MVDWAGISDVKGLATVVVETMIAAHDNLARAQVESRQRGEGVYGQIWRSLCDDLATQVSRGRLEVQVITPAKSSYKLPVIGDVILFPWRPAGGQTPTAIAFGTSPTRRRLWEQSLDQDLLPLEDLRADHASDGDPVAEQVDDVSTAAMTDVVLEAARQNLRVVIVAMTSDARRLRSIEWGEAALDDRGILQWLPGSLETLYVLSDAAAPVSTSPQTFADGSAPTPRVALKLHGQPKAADGSTEDGTDVGGVGK